MNDWTLIEGGMMLILIFGVPLIIAASVGIWNCLKSIGWFIGKLIECAIWRLEHIHGIRFFKRRRKRR